MRNNSPPISGSLDGKASSDRLNSLPAHLRRKIVARWEEWIPWVLIHLRRRDYESAVMAAESTRLRRRHSEHLLTLLWAGIGMRQVRRHRLDDPRITDEVRAMLVRAAIDRRKKGWLARRRAISDPHRMLESDLSNPDIGVASLGKSLSRSEFSRASANEPEKPNAAQEKRVTIDLIQERISKHFNLRELRNENLKARTNRLVIAFPRQIAMYIAKQLTTVSLQEIGRQFGGMHHTTVLHSINRIAEMRRSDKALDRTIKQLMHGGLV